MSSRGENQPGYIWDIFEKYGISNTTLHNPFLERTTTATIYMRDLLRYCKENHTHNLAGKHRQIHASRTLFLYDQLPFHQALKDQLRVDDLIGLCSALVKTWPVLSAQSTQPFTSIEPEARVEAAAPEQGPVMPPFSVPGPTTTLYLVLDDCGEAVMLKVWSTVDNVHALVTEETATLGIPHKHIFRGFTSGSIDLFQGRDVGELVLFVVDSETTPKIVEQMKLARRAWRALKGMDTVIGDTALGF